VSVFTVTESPNFVSGVYSRPYLVRNAGTVAVYLGQDASLAVGAHSISMPPGSTLNWSGETQLWACTAPGETSTLEVLYTGDSAFTPGPTTVNANITPVSDNLFYQSLNPSAFVYQSPWIDVLDYQTMILEVVSIIAAGSPYDGESDLMVQIQWSTNSSGITTYEPDYIGAAGAGSTRYQFPVISRYVQFTIRRKNAAIQLQLVNIKLNGVGYVLPEQYRCHPEPFAYDTSQFTALNFPVNYSEYQYAGMFSVSGNMAAVRNGFVPVPHTAGTTSIGWGRIIQANTGGTAIALGVMQSAALQYSFRRALTAAAVLEFEGLSFQLPRWPIALQVQTVNAATVTSYIMNYSA